jgi:predicted nucleotidyltransferase
LTSPVDGVMMPVVVMNPALEKAIAALKAAGAKEVYLFGSAAQGGFSEDSDIDLAVRGLPPERFFRAISQASTFLDRPLDVVDLDEASPFTRHLEQEGLLVRVG